MATLDPSTGLTCMNCRLVFKTPEIQRDHYKSDWHRYNLKRQVAELPPISYEQFTGKVQAHKDEKDALIKDSQKPDVIECTACNKKFSTENQLENHMQSKKHLEIVKNGRKGPKFHKKKARIVAEDETTSEETKDSEEKDVEMEEASDDDSSSGWATDNGEEDEEMEEGWDYNEKDALPVTSCLFCPQSTSSLDRNLEHMQKYHGFTLPDKQYLADAQGMVAYLGLKVGAGRVCIYCPDRKGRYATVQGVQKHMVDKEHCRISREPQSMLEFADWYDYSALYDEIESKEENEMVDDGWTLTLPSGAKIGHRLLMRYYKQSIKGDNGSSADAGRLAIEKASGQHRALSWLGGQGSGKAVVPQRALLQAAKDRKMIDRVRRRFLLRWGVKSNKLFKSQGRYGDN